MKVLGGTLDYPPGKDSLFVLARTINDFMPRHMFTLTMSGLARVNKPMQGAKIALLGWAFIANSDDARNMPAELVRDLVRNAGGTVAVHDPWVDSYPGVPIDYDIDALLASADAVVIFTSHNEYRQISPAGIRKASGCDPIVIVDWRNVIDPDMFIKAGFVYKGIGRGDVNNHPLED